MKLWNQLLGRHRGVQIYLALWQDEIRRSFHNSALVVLYSIGSLCLKGFLLNCSTHPWLQVHCVKVDTVGQQICRYKLYDGKFPATLLVRGGWKSVYKNDLWIFVHYLRRLLLVLSLICFVNCCCIGNVLMFSLFVLLLCLVSLGVVIGVVTIVSRYCHLCSL